MTNEIIPWVIAALSLAWAIYANTHSRYEKRIADQDEKIRQLELDMARQQSPLMKQVQDLLSAGLHHPDPDHVRQDHLLEKLDKNILEPDEVPELDALLDKQIHDAKTPAKEVKAAKALKAIMPIVVDEQQIIAEVAETKKAEG
jgi:hypothetical protein